MTTTTREAPATPASRNAAPPAPAAMIETHTSVLVFLADRVYKVKKTADLGFLDFRTRQARLAACEAEVALNRRLSPDVYLGVADVTGPDGELCDHMVVMRRLPPDRRLSTLVEHGVDVTDSLRGLARLLAAFHARCETSQEITEAGSPETLRGLWAEGLDGVRPFRGSVLDARTVDEIDHLAAHYLAGREPLLRERQRAERIRDGHGDLLAGDIFCLDDGPRVLDCLEFDQRLRVGDVLGDVAFLAMDLQRIGRADLAGRFLGWYREFAGETHPRSLEDLYVAYRAFVRCKVACLRHAQGSPEALVEARALADLTLARLRRARVRLVLVGGLPASGKSTLASGLADAEGWTLLRSDVVRKERAGLPATQHVYSGVREGIYSADATDAVYGELLRRAETALTRGETVVIDASWSSHAHRRLAAALAGRTASDLVQLRCAVSPEVAAPRIARRRADGGDASDATLPVLHDMATRADPWPESTTIHTAAPVADTLRAARRAHLLTGYRR